MHISGTISQSGLVYKCNSLSYYINNVTSGLYVGLMSNNVNVSQTYQLPAASGIKEISGSGYSRQLSSTWSVSSSGLNQPYIYGSNVNFTVSGSWANVNGYFVSETISGYDVLWSEIFPPSKFGIKASGDNIYITPRLYESNL